MRVVLTREAGRNERLLEWLAGVDVEEVPLTTTVVVDEAAFDAQIDTAPRGVRYLVVTSARAAAWAARAARVIDAPLLSVGAETSRALRDLDLVVEAQGESARDLAGLISAGPVVSLGAAQTRPELAEALSARGIGLYHVVCYETRALELTDHDRETLARADVILIGAPSAWEVARDFVAPRAWVIVPGATTAQVVAESHHRVLAGWGPELATRVAGLDVEGG